MAWCPSELSGPVSKAVAREREVDALDEDPGVPRGVDEAVGARRRDEPVARRHDEQGRRCARYGRERVDGGDRPVVLRHLLGGAARVADGELLRAPPVP